MVLPNLWRGWYCKCMKPRILLPRLLATLAVLGLLMTPFVRMAVAMPGGMSDMAGAPAAAEMPADMPCCPDDAPAIDCTEDCPFIALCTMGSTMNLPANAGLPAPLDLQSQKYPDTIAEFTSLNRDPPLKPPQS